MKNITTDNDLLNEKLNQALDLLNKYNNSIGLNNVSKFKSKNSNNFQAANLILANLNNLCKSKSIKTVDTNSVLSNTSNQFKTNKPVKTLNESIAAQMLEQFDWLKTAAFQLDPNLSLQKPNSDDILKNMNVIDSLDKLEKLIRRIKMTRTNLYGRLYQFFGNDNDCDLFLNVCNKCTGNVQIV
jgi:hypothetical protein